MAGYNSFNARDQLLKICEELREAKNAYFLMKNAEPRYKKWLRQDYGKELLDIIHATETALRMEFTPDEVEQLRNEVIQKNTVRDYYSTAVDKC